MILSVFHPGLCTYQGFVRIPILKDILHFFMRRLNRKIAFQDRRIVQTQVPKPSALHGGENLLQGDLPIVEYRRRRQEMMWAIAKFESKDPINDTDSDAVPKKIK